MNQTKVYTQFGYEIEDVGNGQVPCFVVSKRVAEYDLELARFNSESHAVMYAGILSGAYEVCDEEGMLVEVDDSGHF